VNKTITNPPQRRLRGLVKDAMPPIALRAFRKLANREVIRFRHGYSSWEEASIAASGYDADEIIRKVYMNETVFFLTKSSTHGRCFRHCSLSLRKGEV